MFESNDIDSPIKIIDFGLARKHSKRNQFVTGFGGTGKGEVYGIMSLKTFHNHNSI